jgi:electron transfer flavoprotein beta subunit
VNIFVCVKQVPDVEGRIAVEKGAVSAKSLVPGHVLSSLDAFAIETGLALKDAAKGKVTVVTLGRPAAETSLRDALSLGADEAVLLCDAAFENLDSFGTAMVLAKVLAPLPHDVVVCGQKADDTQAGMTAAYLAQLLGLPMARNVVKAATQKDGLRMTRKLEKGNREIVECGLPALLMVEAGETAPRHATIKGVLAARKAVIRKLGAADLGLSIEDLHASTKMKVLSVTPPKPRMKGLFVPGAALSQADMMTALIGGGLVQKKSNFLEGDPARIAQQVVQFCKKEKIIPG